MVEKEDNQIKITIFGQEYSVKAPADPTYIKNIAEYVDTKMREVQSGFSSTQSSNRIAILSAMLFASSSILLIFMKLSFRKDRLL